TYMFPAVSSPFGRDHARRNAGCINHELLLAAALERNEPERRGLDAVAADREEAVVLVNGSLDAGKGMGNFIARLDLDRHLAGLVANDDVIFEKGRGILRDGLELLAQ